MKSDSACLKEEEDKYLGTHSTTVMLILAGPRHCLQPYTPNPTDMNMANVMHFMRNYLTFFFFFSLQFEYSSRKVHLIPIPRLAIDVYTQYDL